MPHLTTYLRLADHSEQILAESFRTTSGGHADVADVYYMCETLAGMSDAHRRQLSPVLERYGDGSDVDEPERLRAASLDVARQGEIGLLRDLQDLHLLATLVQSTWTVVVQGAQGLRDRELLDIAQSCLSETSRQLTWLQTRMKAAAPQALIVAP